MAEAEEFRCFVGGLSWDTTERTLMDEFKTYQVTEAKVISDPESGRSRGFGFVTFSGKQDMDDAIQGMHGKEIDGRSITVDVAQPRGAGGGGGGPRRGGDRGGGRSGGGGDCFKCGEPGHWARDCPSGGGDRYSSRGSRSYGGGDRYGSSDRGGGGGGYDRYGEGRSGGGAYRGEGRRERSGPYERRGRDRDYRDSRDSRDHRDSRDTREDREGRDSGRD